MDEYKKLKILLQPNPILEWKWVLVSMNFIIGFPKTTKHNNAIMVVVEKFRKVAHFVAIKSTNFTSDIAQIFIKVIV